MTRTRGADRYSSELTVQMGATDLDASVLTTAGSPTSPCKLVIDHDDPAKAEIILFDGTFDGTTFRTTNIANRYLQGSAAGSGITHDVGAKVIYSSLGSHHEEIHDELDAHEAASAVHGAVSAATANTIVRRDANSRFQAASPSVSADVATKGFVDAKIPIGGIILWSGSVGAIPAGWALCDGTAGTPDLRGRFLVGAGGAYTVGQTGGAQTHTHTSAGHSHSIPAGGAHNHTGSTGSGPADRRGVTEAGANNEGFASHSHSIPGVTDHNHGGTSGSTTPGSTGSTDQRPPFYALAYIQRVA